MRVQLKLDFYWMEPALVGACVLQVAPAIKEVMQQKGDAMIGFQPLGDMPNFFRIVFAGAKLLQDCNLDALLQRMDVYGQHLFPA